MKSYYQSLPAARRFFYHYNKPASLKAGVPKLSVHFEDTCHIVDHVKCAVQCESHHQTRQPRCIMRGHARTLTIVNDVKRGRVATIWNDKHSS